MLSTSSPITVKCPQCGTDNPADGKSCISCSNTLPATDDSSQAQRPTIGPEPEQDQQPATDYQPAAIGDTQALAALVSAEVAEVQNRLLDRIATLDKQLADVQMDQVRASRPWWQNPVVLVALSAFLLSLTTTIFSYMQARQREAHDARVELRSLIERLSEIPRETATLTQVYTDSFVVSQLGGLLQEENAVLAKHAREVMNSIPGQVSSGEYIVVANALANSNLIDEAVQMYRQAESLIADYNDGVSLYQSEGQLLFLTGKPEEGRTYFQRAVNIFDEFPSNSDFLKISINMQTQIFWAYSEYSIGQCKNARDHTKGARDLFNSLVAKYPSARATMQSFEQQIRAMESAMRACLPR